MHAKPSIMVAELLLRKRRPIVQRTSIQHVGVERVISLSINIIGATAGKFKPRGALEFL